MLSKMDTNNYTREFEAISDSWNQDEHVPLLNFISAIVKLAKILSRL